MTSFQVLALFRIPNIRLIFREKCISNSESGQTFDYFPYFLLTLAVQYSFDKRRLVSHLILPFARLSQLSHNLLITPCLV